MYLFIYASPQFYVEFMYIENMGLCFSLELR